MSITKEDIEEWKASDVTQAVMKTLRTRIEDGAMSLVRNASGADPEELARHAVRLEMANDLLSDIELLEVSDVQ